MSKKVKKRIIILGIVLLLLSAGGIYLRQKHGKPVNEEAVKKNADSTANSKLDNLNSMFNEDEKDSL